MRRCDLIFGRHDETNHARAIAASRLQSLDELHNTHLPPSVHHAARQYPFDFPDFNIAVRFILRQSVRHFAQRNEQHARTNQQTTDVHS